MDGAPVGGAARACLGKYSDGHSQISASHSHLPPPVHGAVWARHRCNSGHEVVASLWGSVEP